MPGSDQAIPFDPATQAAMSGIMSTAQQGNPLAGASMSSLLGILNNGGMDPAARAALGSTYDVATGGKSIGTGGLYSALFGQAGMPGVASRNLSGLASGGDGIGMEGDFRGLFGSNPNALSMYGTGIASGANGIDSSGFSSLMGRAGEPGAIEKNLSDYASGKFVNGGSPEFNKALDTQAGKLATDVGRDWSSAGRYGSPGMAKAMTESIGDLRTKAMSDEIAREQGMQFNAAGALSGEQNQNLSNMRGLFGDVANVQGQNIGNRLNAAGALSNEQQGGFSNNRGLLGDITNMRSGDIANRLAATGQMSQEEAQKWADQFSAAGGLTGVEGQNISNMMGAGSNYNNAMNGAYGNLFNAFSAAPGVYDQQYAPYRQMAQVGAMNEDYATRQRQAQLDYYNQKQQAPWQRLQAYESGITGTGNYPTTNSTVTPPSNLLGNILGGALTAGSLVSGIPNMQTGWNSLFGGATPQTM